MSLTRMFKEMADRQLGILARFRTTYSYVLVPTPRSKEIQRAKTWKILSSNPCWTESRAMEKFPVKTDAESRDILFSLTRGTRCYDLSKSAAFPVLVADDGTKSLIVKTSTCKACEHYGTMRGPRRGTVPFCRLHRDRNKTLVVDTLNSAAEKVDRFFGHGERSEA